LEEGKQTPSGPVPNCQGNLSKTILGSGRHYNESDGEPNLAVIVPANSKALLSVKVQLICTTSSYVTSSIVTQNSCYKADQRYVHIRIETHSELESNAIDFAMLHEPEDNADALVAMILVGGDQQNKPILVEAREKICYNEFVNTGTQSLFTRLLQSGFQSTNLEE